jgi:glycosyltransferase involved in cell wall biosynthesis
VRRPDDDTLVIGGAGIPDWRKGTTLWLQMAAEVRRLVGPSTRFVWVGVPEWSDHTWYEGAKFRREAHLMGLDDMVEFIPPTPKPMEHFAGFDIFAMTSWEDPCPLVVLENMGLAKPVVCFAGGGGAPEVVGDTGVIIPDFDPQAMARAIADLAADPQQRARLGALARQRVLANFTDRVQVPKDPARNQASCRSVVKGIQRNCQDLNYAMSEFHTTYQPMITLGVHIRSALRRRGFWYLEHRAWAKVGRRLV